MKRGRTSRKPAIDHLELRVLLNASPVVANEPMSHAAAIQADAKHASVPIKTAGAVGHLSVRATGRPSVGYLWSSAFTPLTLKGTFNPSANTEVVFTDRSGRRFQATADGVSSSAVQTTVPVFLRKRTGLPATGGFHVSVLQQTGTKTTRTPVIFHLQVEPLASTGQPPGTLVELVLADMQGVVIDEIQKAQAVAALSKGTVDESALISDLQGQATALAIQRQAFLPLVNGEVSSVELSAPGGKPLVYTRDSLTLMDRVVAAPFTPGTGSIAAESLYVRRSAAVVRALGSFDYTAAINQFFSNIVHLPTAQEIQQAEQVQKQWLSDAKLLSAELSVGGALVGGPAGFETGTAVGKTITAAVWVATTISPYIGPATGNEASLNDVLSGNANQKDVNANLQFLFGQAYDASSGKIVDALVKDALGGEVPLGSALGYMYDKLGDFAKDSVKTEGESANSADTIATSLNSPADIPSGSGAQSPVNGPELGGQPTTTPLAPAIGLSTSELMGTVQQFTSTVSGSFTVQNTGGGSLDVSISADSSLIHISTSEQGNTLGVVTITVDTSGLAPGSYSGRITVSSPNASNNPQSVSIIIVVVSPLGQNPTFPSLPPTFQPPIYQPPVFQPPTNQPPVYQPPVYQPPGNQPPMNPSNECTYDADYRFPDTGFDYNTGTFQTLDALMAEIQSELNDYRQGGDPNTIPTEYRIFENCNGQEIEIQDITV